MEIYNFTYEFHSMRITFSIILLFFIPSFSNAQAEFDQCNNAGMLCPQQFTTVDNFGATVTFCPSCEDDFTNCFTPLNSIWLTFETNETGGDATITGLNINFNLAVNNDNNSLNLMVLEASIPCDASSYTEIACLNEQDAAFAMNVVGLNPNSTYFIVISGTTVGPGAFEPSEFSLDIRVAGVAVNRPPASIGFGASNTVVCTGDPVQLIVDTTFCPGGYEINWFKNNVFWFTSSINSVYVDDLENGDEIRAETTCFTDCPVDVTSNTVTFVVLHFFVDAGADLEIFSGESVQLQGSTSGVNYYWEPELWLSDNTVLDPIAFPEHTTTFFLTATNGVCERTDEMTITVRKDLIIPSVFSPNGDGINDTWEILGAERYPNIQIQVYDRWGQKVFESISYGENKFWNGTYKGKLLSTSTYYYVIDLNDSNVSERILKGPVSIVR